MGKSTKAKKTVREILSKKKAKPKSRSTPTPPKDGPIAERMRQATRAIHKVKKRTRRTMGDQDEEIQRLTEENERLRERVAELESGSAEAATPTPKWKRGILPGQQYIKTDETGAFEKITKQEWDALPQ
jgi:predicted RNase H-like nuclease (RuvC/YqgF family)